jgi:hypothetical protein
MFFGKELPFSQNRHGQPAVKFYRHHHTVHIYRLIPRKKHFYGACCRER